jgi:hypothetical protein
VGEGEGEREREGGREGEREREWRSQIACPYVRSLVANPKSGPDYSVFIMK